jgi:hypothetical protein
MIYHVTAEKTRRWWVLQCVEFPGAISQVKHLSEADEIREAIAFVAQVPESDVEIEVRPQIPATVAKQIESARRLREEALNTQRIAAERMRGVAVELHRSGYTLQDVGDILNVTKARAQQLVDA